MADYDISDINLPVHPEAENSVIGAVLLDGGILGDLIFKNLHAEHFYIDVNRRIYEIMVSMYMSNSRVDIVTVIDECVRHSIFDSQAAAKTHLSGLMERVSSVSAAVKYAEIIIDKYLLRKLIVAGKEIIDAANNSPEPANNIVDLAEQKIYDIGAGAKNNTLTHIRGIIYDRVRALNDLVQESAANGGKPVMSGAPTGFIGLDRTIFGLNKSDLIIIAARPAMGKTSFAMNIAVNMAQRVPGKQICVFSLEMSKEQIVSRILCSEAQLSSDIMRTGRLQPEQFGSFMQAADVLQNLEIYIDDTPGCSVANIKSKLRRMNDVGAVIIDHLQLMIPSNNYHGNRVLEVSEITRSLKIMAKELNVPVILLSQLARGPEQRNDKRPMLSDLRDSGSIEQDADVVLFLYRNSYYDKEDPNQNLAECIVAKNRHGETGTVYLGWRGEYTRFYNIEYKVQNG